MQHFIHAVKGAIAQKNWYAALTITLTLPDIVGQIEYGKLEKAQHYKNWFNKYVRYRYTKTESVKAKFQHLGVEEAIMREVLERLKTGFEKRLNLDNEPRVNIEHVRLSGADCYALRCAFLHQGDMDIESQPAQEYIDKFVFEIPNAPFMHNNLSWSKNKMNIYLQVDVFCNDILFGIEQWLQDIKQDKKKMEKIQAFPQIKIAPNQLMPPFEYNVVDVYAETEKLNKI
jgi:hypothetical protein